MDLAISHVAAVDHVRKLKPFEALNIGTGSGLSVMQMINEFEIQSGLRIMYEFAARRPGDAAKVWADASKAKEKIGFQAGLGAPEMCRDTWRWQSANPSGYQKA